MKMCSKCRIEIGGAQEYCPLCHAHLTGETSENNWPSIVSIRKKDRRVLFLFLAVLIIVPLAVLAYQICHLSDAMPIVLIVAVWIATGEIIAALIIKRVMRIAGALVACYITLNVLLIFTSFWYGEAIDAVPFIMTGIMILAFVLTITDTAGNSFVYFLFAAGAMIASYVAAHMLGQYNGVFWKICTLVGVSTTVIIFVVCGKRISTELKKRTKM